MKALVFIIFASVVLSLSGRNYTEGESIYTGYIHDEQAVYFSAEAFGIKNDGSEDVSEALQDAINQVHRTMKYGILFIPEGTYKISKTIYIWKGIRLIGYGKNRPVFLLDKNTDGFRDEKKYLFHFLHDKPKEGRPIQDANAGTFYSGMRNINIRIAEGNPAAIAVRFHVAQHSFLSYMDFYLNNGNTGIKDIGNEIEFCRFFGGEYAINTGTTSPGWQSLIIDTHFEGQQKAALLTDNAGVMIFGSRFKNVPVAVRIRENCSEKLWVSNTIFENISQTGILISNQYNVHTQINLEDIYCRKVPFFSLLTESGEEIKRQEACYQVTGFTHGLQYTDSECKKEVETRYNIQPLDKLPAYVSSDIPQVPSDTTWINVKDLGAKGDAFSDDTEIIENAVNTYTNLYFPCGHYRITRPLRLKEQTNIIALHPSATQLLLRDSTQLYQETGSPIPLIEVPKNGINIISGIGINTSGVNPRAVGIKWMAGKNSLMNDVKFTGGHGTYGPKGETIPTYNDNRTADGLPYRKWDTQYWSLWITEEGGGTFKDIWTASPYAAAGLYISDTSTEGRIFYMSVEHHVRNEVKIDNVRNWKIYGLQLETESGEGPYCLPLEIKNSTDLLFANTFIYRVSRVTTPCPYAIVTENVKDLHFKGLHNYSWTKYTYENTLFDATHNANIRSREIAYLKLSGNKPEEKKSFGVTKVADGFDFIDGITNDRKGNIYFIDSKFQRIYCWDTSSEKLKLICDLPISPVSLTCDTQGNLIVISQFMHKPSAFTKGDIYAIALNPENPDKTIQMLGKFPLSSVDKIEKCVYQTTNFRTTLFPPVKNCYIAPDNVTIIPITPDLGRASVLKEVKPNDLFYKINKSQREMYVYHTDKKGVATNEKLFIHDGDSDVAVDAEGNVYMASGQILVYDNKGNFLKEIDVPERPSAITFGGKDKKDLYICASTSLYKLEIK